MRRCNQHSSVPLIVTIVTLVFFYMPLVLVSIASFNANKYGGNWGGFSLVWYRKLLHDQRIWEAMCNTIIIGTVATLVSTILGLLAAWALYRSKSRFRGFQYALVYSPLVVPDILLGISLLLLFVSVLGVDLGLTTIIIAHITFCLSYVTMIILGRLQDFDWQLVEAAQDLGATHVQAFFRVTLPVISPAIVAAALFAFTLSIDDFVITYFVQGAGDTTLPIYIEGVMRKGSTAVINALSVVFLLVTFVLVLTSQKLLENKK